MLNLGLGGPGRVAHTGGGCQADLAIALENPGLAMARRDDSPRREECLVQQLAESLTYQRQDGWNRLTFGVSARSKHQCG